jgi:hypothetical protein
MENQNKTTKLEHEVIADTITFFIQREKRVGKRLDSLELQVEELEAGMIQLKGLIDQLIDSKGNDKSPC